MWREMVASRNVIRLHDPERREFSQVAKEQNVRERKRDMLAGVILLAGMLVWFGVGLMLCAYLVTLIGKEIFG
jgi:hypothetical protein